MRPHLILNQHAIRIANQYRQCEQELVKIISQIDRKKAYYKLGHNSLFSYMINELKLSEAVACNISAVVRKSYEVPQLQQKVERGELSLGKARKIAPVITVQNQKKWLEIAKTKTQRQIEREVALAQPKEAIKEKVSYVPPSEPKYEKVQIKNTVPRAKLELGVSENLLLKLRRCQDLESQRCKKPVSLESCLEALVDLYLEKRDPIKKAQRQKARGKIDAKASVSKTGKRVAIPAGIRHQIQLRDQGQCTHKDHKGYRCDSRRHLEVHHIRPVSEGGSNELENLRLLCHGHHKMAHLKLQS